MSIQMLLVDSPPEWMAQNKIEINTMLRKHSIDWQMPMNALWNEENGQPMKIDRKHPAKVKRI